MSDRPDRIAPLHAVCVIEGFQAVVSHGASQIIMEARGSFDRRPIQHVRFPRSIYGCKSL